jgi:hypothetical protein
MLIDIKRNFDDSQPKTKIPNISKIQQFNYKYSQSGIEIQYQEIVSLSIIQSVYFQSESFNISELGLEVSTLRT